MCSHLSGVFGTGSAFAVAARLPGWNHAYVLYGHAAVSRQRSGATPTLVSALRACPSSGPRPIHQLLPGEAGGFTIALFFRSKLLHLEVWRWNGITLPWRHASGDDGVGGCHDDQEAPLPPPSLEREREVEVSCSGSRENATGGGVWECACFLAPVGGARILSRLRSVRI